MALHEKQTLIPLAGSTIHVVEAGDGPAVLLGHSYLWDAEMWRPQIEALARAYRVVAPTLWGHGGSGALPPATEDLRGIARHHLAVMDALGIDRFAVVGLSVGGMWGAELALLAPERVRALVLLDTFLGAEPEASRQRYFGLLRTIEAAGAVPDGVLDAVVPLFFSPDAPARTPALVQGFRERLAGWGRERLLDSVVPFGRILFGRRDVLDEIKGLALPGAVMTGTHDVPRPVSEGRRMAEALGYPFVEIPAAGHIASLEAPDVVTAELAAFLGRERGPPRAHSPSTATASRRR